MRAAEIASLAVILVFTAFMIWVTFILMDDCTDRGGILVTSPLGPKCVKELEQ